LGEKKNGRVLGFAEWPRGNWGGIAVIKILDKLAGIAHLVWSRGKSGVKTESLRLFRRVW